MARQTFTSNGVTVEFNSNVPAVYEALRNAVERGLMVCGEKAVDYAQDVVPVKYGRLKGSIHYQVDGDECYIGTHVKYAKYIEFGTGRYAEGGGRQTPWKYQDDEGNWHQTDGYKPHPFLRPAAMNHAKEYRAILVDSLKNA